MYNSETIIHIKKIRFKIKHLLLVNFFGIQFQTRKRSDFPIFPFSISEYISSSSELNIKFVHCCYIQ